MSATDEEIKHMVNRFLGWRLPEHFSPDAGISFTPEFNVEYNAKQGKPPQRHEPTGTNLFSATQAEEMVRHMLDVYGDDDELPGLVDRATELWRLVMAERAPNLAGSILAGMYDKSQGAEAGIHLIRDALPRITVPAKVLRWARKMVADPDIQQSEVDHAARFILSLGASQ